MNIIVGEVKIKHELANTSGYYLVVANCDKIISAHTTVDEAEQAFASLPHGGTVAWSDVQVVAPGETVSGAYVGAVLVPDPTPFDWSTFIANE